MSATKLGDGIYSVGIQNPIMRIFDVVMKTDYGTTYNSYIVKGASKTALIEACHLTYFDRYLENISEVCDPAEIDYIVLNHCEPDHSGALAKLLSLCPRAKIAVSRAGALYLKGITNSDELPLTVVKDGDTLDLGGRTLRFIAAPFLHWPDSMFTWLSEDKLLFSCDFLGAHYCEPHVFDRNIVYPKKYADALLNYYNAIFGPFAPYVRAGLGKISVLDIETVCASHGPVLTRDGMLPTVIARYKEWSAESTRANKLIPIFFCSAYGNTGKIADALRDGILKAIPDAECEVYDINEHPMTELAAILNASDAFCVGSPTINADAVAPIWQLLSHVDAINNRKRPALVFGSYGWSGEAVPNITARLTGLKNAVFGDGFRTVFVPSEDDLKNATALACEFAQSLQS